MEGNLLLALAIIGGLGLCLALPGGRAGLAKAGFVLLAAAAAVVAYVLVRWISGTIEQASFVALALVGLWGGVRVVTHTKPVYSALYFILVVVATAGLALLAQAELLMVALLLIYAGAILVTYVFVIMLAQQAGGPAPYDKRAREPLLGCVTGFVLLGIVVAQMTLPAAAPVEVAAGEATRGTALAVGVSLFTSYAIGVQLIGVILLAAMVGAVAIARRRPQRAGEVEI